MIQEFRIDLFQISHLESCLKFQHQNFIFLNMSNSDCLYIKVWSTDQNFKPLRIEERIKLTLVIN